MLAGPGVLGEGARGVDAREVARLAEGLAGGGDGPDEGLDRLAGREVGLHAHGRAHAPVGGVGSAQVGAHPAPAPSAAEVGPGGRAAVAAGGAGSRRPGRVERHGRHAGKGGEDTGGEHEQQRGGDAAVEETLREIRGLPAEEPVGEVALAGRERIRQGEAARADLGQARGEHRVQKRKAVDAGDGAPDQGEHFPARRVHADPAGDVADDVAGDRPVAGFAPVRPSAVGPADPAVHADMPADPADVAAAVRAPDDPASLPAVNLAGLAAGLFAHGVLLFPVLRQRRRHLARAPGALAGGWIGCEYQVVHGACQQMAPSGWINVVNA